MTVKNFQPRKRVLQSLLGLEILAILFALSIITCAVLAAELSRRTSSDGWETTLGGRLRPLPVVADELPDSGNVGYPTLVLDEARGYVFHPGKSDLTSEFKSQLLANVGRIRSMARQYGADRIEVVGHTDEQPMKPGLLSNLDSQLVPAVLGTPQKELTATDNVGLGMNRATAVAVYLRSLPELAHFEIVPLSAGQMILPSGKLTTGQMLPDAKRRRIELRLLRLQYSSPALKQSTLTMLRERLLRKSSQRVATQ